MMYWPSTHKEISTTKLKSAGNTCDWCHAAHRWPKFLLENRSAATKSIGNCFTVEDEACMDKNTRSTVLLKILEKNPFWVLLSVTCRSESSAGLRLSNQSERATKLGTFWTHLRHAVGQPRLEKHLQQIENPTSNDGWNVVTMGFLCLHAQ